MSRRWAERTVDTSLCKQVGQRLACDLATESKVLYMSHLTSMREEVQRQIFKPGTLVCALQSCLSFNAICAFLDLGHYEPLGSPLLVHTYKNFSYAGCSVSPRGLVCLVWLVDQGAELL